MAKDPAFLFYPGDWLGGTMYMTHLEKGCYIDLLMLQFNKGKFTLAQAKHMLNTSFELAWANIADKFTFENGLYWNVRLHEEQEKRSRFSESRRNNAKSPKNNGSTSEASAKHMHKHMEDENENENRSKKEDEKAKKEVVRSELIYPFTSEKFMQIWNVFIELPKQKKKPHTSKQMMLKNLSEFDEEFAIKQIELAIQNNWQGLTFSDTKEKYLQHLNTKTNGVTTSTKPTYTNERQQRAASVSNMGRLSKEILANFGTDSE